MNAVTSRNQAPSTTAVWGDTAPNCRAASVVEPTAETTIKSTAAPNLLSTRRRTGSPA